MVDTKLLGQSLQLRAKHAFADEQQIDVNTGLRNLCEGAKQGCMILDRVKPGHIDYVPPSAIEPQPSSCRNDIRGLTVPLRIDTILNDRDAFRSEAIALAQAPRAELAHGVHMIRKTIEDQSVEDAPLCRHNVRIVPPVFGEDDHRPQTGCPPGKRTIKERRVLVRMDHFQAARPYSLGHRPNNAQVETGTSTESPDVNALPTELLTKRANCVKAEDRGVDS
jgi:hypothetical protein